MRRAVEVSARRTQTRDRLVQAALEVFAEKGVTGASVEEICDRAGFTRGAFYSNFDSKDDLCVAVLEHQAEENLASARAAVASLGPVPISRSLDQVIGDAIGVFLDSQRNDPSWIKASSELRLYAAREASLRPAYLAHVRHFGEVFATLVGDAVKQFGVELSVPRLEAVEMLQAVFEYGALMGLIGGDASDRNRGAHMTALLRSMIRPASSPA